MEWTETILDELIAASGFRGERDIGALLIVKCMAVNPETPAHVLDMLAGGQTETAVLECLAGNSAASPLLLAQLAVHPCADVRLAVAENPSAPTTLLAALARDESPDVRYRLAENPRVPPDILMSVLDDENPYVAVRAAATLRRLRAAGGLRATRGWFPGQGDERAVS